MRQKCPRCKRPSAGAGLSCQSCVDVGNAGPQPDTGRKDDSGKSRPGLIPALALIEVGHVMAFGARKYTRPGSPGENNWQLVDGPIERYADAALRHILSWVGGERNDPEHGRHHLASAVCNLLFILWFELRTKGSDHNG